MVGFDGHKFILVVQEVFEVHKNILKIVQHVMTMLQYLKAAVILGSNTALKPVIMNAESYSSTYYVLKTWNALGLLISNTTGYVLRNDKKKF